MAEFLTTNGISFYNENIIKEAGEELYLLLPNLQLSREFYQALMDCSERGVSIIIVYTNEDLQTEQKLLMGDLANLEVYHSENLNAKCCCSEKCLLISSMDIDKFATSKTLEMGVLVDKNKDEEFYKKTYFEIKSIVNSSRNMNLHKRPGEEVIQQLANVKKIYHGFCITCAMPISYNIETPYCRNCAPKDNNDQQIDLNGNYCHQCGAVSSTERETPLCDICKTENLSD